MEAVVIVVRPVDVPVGLRIFHRQVPEHGGGADQVVVQRGAIEQRLEGAAGLAGAGGNVDLAGDGVIVEIGAADHGEDLGGAGLERDKGGIVEIKFGLEASDLLGHDLLGVRSCRLRSSVVKMRSPARRT